MHIHTHIWVKYIPVIYVHIVCARDCSRKKSREEGAKTKKKYIGIRNGVRQYLRVRSSAKNVCDVRLSIFMCLFCGCVRMPGACAPRTLQLLRLQFINARKMFLFHLSLCLCHTERCSAVHEYREFFAINFRFENFLLLDSSISSGMSNLTPFIRDDFQ